MSSGLPEHRRARVKAAPKAAPVASIPTIVLRSDGTESGSYPVYRETGERVPNVVDFRFDRGLDRCDLNLTVRIYDPPPEAR